MGMKVNRLVPESLSPEPLIPTNASKHNLFDAIKRKFRGYKNTNAAKDWLNSNLSRIKRIFEDYTLRDFIFEPFKAVFQTPAKNIDANIYSIITQVAIINAVLAGLPGKMGGGVWVSVALEGWMAFCIARHVGIDINWD